MSQSHNVTVIAGVAAGDVLPSLCLLAAGSLHQHLEQGRLAAAGEGPGGQRGPGGGQDAGGGGAGQGPGW